LEYKKKEKDLLEAIAEAESLNLLGQFRNSPEKMG
jgi:hypothetical protein